MQNYKVQQINQQILKTIYLWCQHIIQTYYLLLKQHLSLLRLLPLNGKNPQLPQGLFTCNNKNCKLCMLYIKPWTNFKTSNNINWYIRSHIACQNKVFSYYLKCNKCNYTMTHFWKTVDSYSCLNNHITSCRLGGFMDEADSHIFFVCRSRNKNRFSKY